MTMSRCKILLYPLVAVLALWLVTGGIVVHEYWVLPFDSYDKTFSPYIRVDVKTGVATKGIPYVFEYVGDEVPFDIQIQYLTHKIVENPTLTIEDINIIYVDGDNDNFGRRCLEATRLTADIHGYIDDFGAKREKPCLRAVVMLY